MSKLIDLSGKKFGRLKVINIAYKKNYNYYWNCICDCGKQKIVMGSHLRSGRIKSCGCLSMEALKKRATTHGLTKTRIYKIWSGIMILNLFMIGHILMAMKKMHQEANAQ